jgi:hypothetical protein
MEPPHRTGAPTPPPKPPLQAGRRERGAGCLPRAAVGRERAPPTSVTSISLALGSATLISSSSLSLGWYSPRRRWASSPGCAARAEGACVCVRWFVVFWGGARADQMQSPGQMQGGRMGFVQARGCAETECAQEWSEGLCGGGGQMQGDAGETRGRGVMGCRQQQVAQGRPPTFSRRGKMRLWQQSSSMKTRRDATSRPLQARRGGGGGRAAVPAAAGPPA